MLCEMSTEEWSSDLLFKLESVQGVMEGSVHMAPQGTSTPPRQGRCSFHVEMADTVSRHWTFIGCPSELGGQGVLESSLL